MDLRRFAAFALSIVLALVATTTARAQDTAADETVTATSPELTALRERFQRFYRSLVNSGGLSEADRPGVDAFSAEIDAYRAAHPDDATAVAMAMQMCLWLDDEDGAATLFARLVELRPKDVDLALAHVDFLQRRAQVDEAAVDAALRGVFERFPDDTTARRRWAKRLRDQLQYDEAIEVLTAIEIDPAEDPQSAYDLAETYFATQQFEKANETLTSIPDDFTTGASFELYQLRQEIDKRRAWYEEYLTAWPAEQDRRRAEAESDDLPQIEIVTSKGRVVVELFEDDAPNTVANFVALANSGFYEQTTFHRFMPDFMIQGGDPKSKPGGEGVPGTGNPGYYIADEHSAESHRKHFADSIAMGKRPAPNTAGCQFYFNHRPTPWLNGQHTVFGRVIEGRDVVLALRGDDQIITMIVRRKREHPYEPETLPLETTAVTPETGIGIDGITIDTDQP